MNHTEYRCPICLEDRTTADSTVTLMCSHKLCTPCYGLIRTDSVTTGRTCLCPLCRTEANLAVEILGEPVRCPGCTTMVPSVREAGTQDSRVLMRTVWDVAPDGTIRTYRRLRCLACLEASRVMRQLAVEAAWNVLTPLQQSLFVRGRV